MSYLDTLRMRKEKMRKHIVVPTAQGDIEVEIPVVPGPRGPMGIQGPKGDSITGPKGDKGDKGDSITGPKGDKGDKGDSIKGDKGDPGKDGESLKSIDATVNDLGNLIMEVQIGETMSIIDAGRVRGRDGRGGGSSGGGTWTHNKLRGLAEGDDHTQYSRVDGTRDFTGVVGGVTPTADEHLTTKDYVDTLVASSGVASITGTANQVIASAATGAVILSLPQDIHTGATPTFAGMTINGNMTITGTVDGVDVGDLKTDVDGFPDELKNLTTAEIQQLENIGTSAISSTEWGYLAAMNQGVATTDDTTFNSLNITTDLTVTGNLTVNGTTVTVNAETVQVEDNLLVINYGEVGVGVTAGTAGIEVERGSLTNYQFLFNEADDAFRIGEVGGLQAVATREDAPTDNGIAFWDAASFKFETSSNLTWDGTLNVAGDISITASNQLNFAATSADKVVLYPVDGTNDYKIGIGSTQTFYNVHGSAKHNFQTGGTERLRITSTQAATNFTVSSTVPHYAVGALDTNTGMGSRTGDVLNFITGGTDVLEVSNAGMNYDGAGTLSSNGAGGLSKFSTFGGTSTREDMLLSGSVTATGIDSGLRAIQLQTALSTGSFNQANANMLRIAAPTIGGTATITNAATLYVASAMGAGTNTITNNYAFWVDSGNSRFDGLIISEDTTDSTSTTTGAIQTDGGLGVAKTLYVGTGANITGNIVVSGTVDGRDLAVDGAKLDAIDQGLATTDSPTFAGLTTTGDARVEGTMYVGATADTDAKLVIEGTSSNNMEIYTVGTSQNVIDSQINMYLNIDTNNNQTTQVFQVGQDGIGSAASPILCLTEGATNGTDSTAKFYTTTDATSSTVAGVIMDGGLAVAKKIYSGTGFVGELTGNVTGNASTATALQTARTIGGVSFDGTANIVPTTIVAADEAADTTCFPAFFTAATGDVLPKTNAALTFNSSTGALGATLLGGTLTTAAQTNITSLGTLTALQVDNLNLDGNTLSSTSGGVTITPLAGQVITLDTSTTIDGGVITNTGSISTTTTLHAGGIIDTDDTTDSTSGTTGSIHTDGGLGVAKTIYCASTTDSTSATTGAIISAGGAGFAKNVYSGQRFSNAPGKFVVKGTATLGSTAASLSVNVSGFSRYRVRVQYALNNNLAAGIIYLRCLPNGNTTTTNYNEFYNTTAGTTNRVHQQTRGFNIGSVAGSSQRCEGIAEFIVAAPSEGGGVFTLDMLSNGLSLNSTAPSKVQGGWMSIGGVSTLTSLVFEIFTSINGTTPSTGTDYIELDVEVYGYDIYSGCGF